MIALFQIALPFQLLILPDERLPTLSYKGDTVLKRVGEFQLIVEPPYRSQRPDQKNVHDPWVEPNPNVFNPADPQPVDADVELNGKAAVRCDAIAAQIIGADFDRRRGVPFDTVDRLLALACDAANGVLQRIRVLTRAPHMKRLDPEAVAYRLVFLDDSAEPIAPDAERFSETFNASLRIQMTAVTPTTWQQAVDLGDYETPPWDELLLDAMDLDVEVGPSLVLAAAAVETRIATALDVLAEGEIPGALWTWISDRRQEPSLVEQLDVLLEALGGRSLKDDPRLWEAGVHLRDARNSFVHEGRALFGRAPRKVVTREKARELVAQAIEIIDFIEALLPECKRRPRLELETPTTVVTRFPLAPPQPHTSEQLSQLDESDRDD